MSKHYIITGASRGIGFETALYLSKQGADVTAIARSGGKLEELNKLSDKTIRTLQLDLASENAVYQLKQHLEKNRLQVDGLVNNAGLLINRPFLELSDKEWEMHLFLNLIVPVRIIRKLFTFFNPGCHILNIGSMGGFQGSSKFPGLTAYSVSKGALAILTECLSVELHEHNIITNCLCLGAVQTEMLSEAFPGFDAPVQPEQMGSYIGHFLMEGHQFYNGKILPVALNNPS